MPELIEIGVLVALGAWVITQIQLIRTYRRVGKAQQDIKEDIDAKRQETQAFVDSRIDKLERSVGGFEARMTAQMPPNVHGELEEVRAEIEEINVGLRKEFEELPERIRFTLIQEEGRQAQQMMATAKDLNADLKTELAAVNAQIPHADDIRAKILKAITREPTPKERKDMGAVGELIWNFGRMKAAEYLQSGEGIPGSVTYTVTPRKGNTEF